ncbi:UPF0606 protein KIAA1549L isoform X1 [Coregonus clupeaformis]|uniref:UPF0606 protein KIAA1549L isoform X1 n=1 Tax=Coregonus clupeaformis TaxID=59861 RepID=UPI001E1C46C3|nr:UPF0606 protein KIAA1549L isoform X1 [Coregonus clupeaformis]
MASKHVRNSLEDLIVSGINNARAIGSIEWIGVGMGSTLCFQKNGKTLGLDRMWTKCILSVGMVLLLMQSVLAADDEGRYNGSSGHASLPQDPAVTSNLSARATPVEDGPLAPPVEPTDPSDPSGATAESTREKPGFSSVLTLLASSDQEPQAPVQPSVLANASSASSSVSSSAINNDNQTAGTTAPVANSTSNTSSEEAVSSLPANPDLPTVPAVSSLATLGESDSTLPDNVTSPFSTHTWNTTTPARADTNTTTPSTTAAHTNPTPDTVTNESLQLTTVTTTTVTPLTVTTTTLTPQTTTASTTEAVTTIPRTTTTTQEVTNIQETTLMTTTTDPPTTTNTTTSAPATTTAPTTITTTTAPTTTLTVPTTTTETTPGLTTTEPPPTSAEEEIQPCNITEKTWVKTVLSMQLRRNRLDIIVRQNLSKGLTHALQRAFNDTSVYVQIERDLCSPHNVTLGYYVASGKTVYIASVVVETVKAYGFDKVLADIRKHSPLVMAVLVPVAPWAPSLSVHLQLKTVLRFVGPADNIKSCSFVQVMEQRLENAFEEAQDKVLESYSGLSVEIQSTAQAIGSSAVSLVYVVKNQDAVLNGTVSSGLLNQLTAELVGYFLFFPPLVIAEPLEYYNLNTSTATKHYWVITVIQDVDSSSLERNYQSFASLMEQRLAELFLVAGRQGSQGSRFRRATTVGDYTVQMVGIRRLPGPKSPAEMTYYAQMNGAPITGTTAAKTLSTLDSQTMALTLGYFIQLQADPVVKVPPANLWVMAVLTPVALVMVVVVMVTAILCKRNRVIFKTGAFRSFKTRSKTSYRREGSYHRQPVQGFDYAKKHMGHQQGEETISVTKETLVLGLPVRDAPLSLDRKVHQDGTASKRPPSADIIHKGLPSEDGSVTSNESGKLNTGKSSMVRRAAAQNSAKEDLLHKRNADPYEDHTGSLRLITIKPMAAQPTYSYPSSSNHSQDSVVLNGEANVGLKQKSDIEHYRNKQRQKANRKAYCDFPVTDNGIHPFNPRERHSRHENAKEPMTAEEKRASYAGCHIRRHPPSREPAYWSRQSLATSSPSPLETEMDLLVLRERSRRGIRNSGYDVEPFEETNVDRLMSSLGYGGSHQVKGLSDSSTLSSQPSIGEVRQQMQLLLGNAFGLAPDEAPPANHHHHPHLHPHLHSSYNPSHTSPYSEGVTSAPGTMNHPCGGGRQRGSPYGPEMHQCSLPKPGFRFTQLPDMGVGPPPTLIPSRPGPPSGTSMRRSTPDISLKPRVSEASEMQNQHNGATYLPINRAPFPAVTVDQSMTSYSGNPMTAVYAISANHPGYSDYFVMSPPSSYGSPSWMSYPPEPEDIPHQWNDTVNTNPCHLETIC